MKVSTPFPQNLPVLDILDSVIDVLNSQHELVLQAPPGAGKTTVVPLALLNEPWLAEQKILVLEPRRLAARNAAVRMADLLKEPVGQTVGYRVRLDSKVSNQTRIEVVTEGILTRMLNEDPSLEGVGLIIFDEFHERSLEADLGLALTLQARKLFRSSEECDLPLKLIVMSATLDDNRIASLLGEKEPAPLLISEGRQYPVHIKYSQPWQAGENTVDRVISTVKDVIHSEQGSILAFLPGQNEIRRVNEGLASYLQQQGLANVVLSPLFGDLSLNEQRQAIAPPTAGKRKVVLATAIAESSLTIEGVTIVVDAGLSRTAVFDPRTGMTRLHTTRLSKASSTQRMGRAGRMAPGVCYRLWSESQQDQLASFSAPEILQADLAPLALACMSWGIQNPTELEWLDPPPAAPYNQALDLLSLLGAIEKSGTDLWVITPHGEAMATFPAHPRLAHMLLKGKEKGVEQLAANIAALIGERDVLGRDAGSDIRSRLEIFNQSSKRHQRVKQQSQQFYRLLDSSGSKQVDYDSFDDKWIGFLLACAYPDRIACRRGVNSLDYLLSNGRAAALLPHDGMSQHEWIVAAEVGGHNASRKDQVFIAAPLDSSLFEADLKEFVHYQNLIEWDDKAERFIAERQQKVGCLVISREPLSKIDQAEKVKVLARLVRKKGLNILSWTKDVNQWRARVSFLRTLDQETWPDFSDQALLDSIEEWLSPYLNDVNHVNHFSRLELKTILQSTLAWQQQQKLDELAPEKMSVPSGSNITIDYTQNPPVLAVRLQEMFGCLETPSVANGKVRLMIHLLSPAQRPLAVTQDLTSFWQNAYLDVKKDMKGRYPKHYWPDDPLIAEPTSRAKPRR